MQKYFDAGVHEIRLVFNEPNKDAYLKALRAAARSYSFFRTADQIISGGTG